MVLHYFQEKMQSMTWCLSQSGVAKKKKKKSPQIINARHCVGKREPSYTVGGNVNFGAAHHGKQYGGSSKN